MNRRDLFKTLAAIAAFPSQALLAAPAAINKVAESQVTIHLPPPILYTRWEITIPADADVSITCEHPDSFIVSDGENLAGARNLLFRAMRFRSRGLRWLVSVMPQPSVAGRIQQAAGRESRASD